MSVKPMSEGYLRTPGERELEEVRRRIWFRDVGGALARELGEPVLFLFKPPDRPATENGGPRGTLPYLVPLSQADRVERNTPHEVLGAPAGDTVQ